nr:hypothetical protein [Dickeya oryzae]
MVRATLDDRKTQTRRAVNASTSNLLDLQGQYPHKKYNIGCPLGASGDRIWVRETWGVVSHAFDDDGMMTKWIPDRPATAINEMPFGNGYYSGHVIYAADGSFTWGDDDGYEDGRSCWKPSIFMPRAASRITLEIAKVRVERLTDISEEDARAEGAPPSSYAITPPEAVYRVGFRKLWESLYGEESWQKNPWCWVIEFQRVSAD